MTIDKSLPKYELIDEKLRQQSIALTGAEIHGLITGLLCGGNIDDSWQTLMHDLTNEGLAFPLALAQPLRELYDTTFELLDDTECNFNLLLPPDEVSVFDRADGLAGWVNHFLLGFGLAEPKFNDRKEIKEIVTDLREIGMLGYDEAEDQTALDDALEEVIEYVRVAVQLCYISLAQPRAKRQGQQDAASAAATIDLPISEIDDNPTLH